MWLEIILLGAILLLIIKVNKKPSTLPPGEWGWPIIGVIPPKGEKFLKFLTDCQKKHGDVFTLKIGGNVFIVLNNYDVIKSALSKPEIQGRPNLFTFQIFNFFKNVGLISSWASVWQTNRRFALRHLRDFGLGKTRMQDIIQCEADALVGNMEKQLNKPSEIKWTVNVAVLNVLWSLVADRRYDIDDKDIQKFADFFSKNVEIMDGPVALLDMFPTLHTYIPTFIKHNWMHVNDLEDTRDELVVFLKTAIAEHIATLDRENPRDYIDMYLIEKEQDKNISDFTATDDCLDLVSSLSDLFVAGSETTSSTLRWLFLLLAAHNDIQDKLHMEIDEAIPADRTPCLEDREKMPYFEAVLCEAQRYASLIPNGIPHCTSEDTVIEGYAIPKGTIVMANLQAVHLNPNYWEKPTEFYPRHFLNEDGKFVPNKSLVSFSVGRRQCLGESLAKMELFLFASTILQKYKMAAPPGVTLNTNRNFQAFLNFVYPYKLIITKRGKTN